MSLAASARGEPSRAGIRNGKLAEAWLLSADLYTVDEFFSQHF
jgi:hypothetical protein